MPEKLVQLAFECVDKCISQIQIQIHRYNAHKVADYDISSLLSLDSLLGWPVGRCWTSSALPTLTLTHTHIYIHIYKHTAYIHKNSPHVGFSLPFAFKSQVGMQLVAAFCFTFFNLANEFPFRLTGVNRFTKCSPPSGLSVSLGQFIINAFLEHKLQLCLGVFLID